MELRFIERGTSLTILESTSKDEIIRQFSAKFYDAESHVVFLVECDELSNEADTLAKDTHLKINFFRGPKLYALKALFKANVIINNQHYVQLTQISEIKEGTRRSTPRHDILTTITVFESMETLRSNQAVVQGQSLDISMGGIGLLTNETIPVLDKEHRYLLDFELSKADHFLLPAKLVHRGNAPQSVQYDHDYGFIFDFDGRPDDRTKLLTALFTNRLESRH